MFAQVAVPQALIKSTSKLFFAFTVPLSQFSSTGTTKLLWAYGGTPPLNPDSPSSSYSYHDDRGSFALNVFSTSATTTTPSSTAGPAATAGAGAATARYCVDASNSVCLTAYRDLSATTVNFTVQSTRKGWVGIGVGASRMAGATMYVAWPNGASSGAVIMSQRSTSGHSQPSYVTPQQFTMISTNPPTISVVAGATMTATFSCPDALVSRTGATSFIYAFSDSPAYTPSDPTSGFPEHGGRDCGVFTMDLSTTGGQSGGSASSDGVDADALRKAHGAVMVVGWGVLPAVGVFIARYMKDRLGHLWYILHSWIMQGGVVACTVIGLVLIEVEVSPGPRFVPDHPHKVLGCILVFGILPAQIILGHVSDRLWTAERRAVPWWDKAHWWLGRLAGTLGVVVIFLGIWLYGTETTVLLACFAAWIGVVFIVFGVAERMIGVVHHIKIEPEKGS
ncbi:hypothetical protein HK101_003927 [Irineochytrium annulatum]|nr:hypothetical protein HK101_003927 [Irineochytrium annulatum]